MVDSAIRERSISTGKALKCRNSTVLRGALTSCLIFLAGVKWTCLRNNEPAFPPLSLAGEWVRQYGEFLCIFLHEYLTHEKRHPVCELINQLSPLLGQIVTASQDGRVLPIKLSSVQTVPELSRWCPKCRNGALNVEMVRGQIATASQDFTVKIWEASTGTVNPRPSTLHPLPSTLNPKPDTRNPKPETRNPKSETQNAKPETRNP